MPKQKESLSSSFWWLNATQFFGALNDNLFKLFVIFTLLNLQGEGASEKVLATATILFVLPFILFNAAAGIIADRYSKRSILIWSKSSEFILMLVGLVGFLAQSAPTLYAVLFLMGLQSVFFGPAKYGSLPEQVNKHRLSEANGFIQAFTFIAIILGTILAPLISEQTGGNALAFGASCAFISFFGLLFSFRIEAKPAAGTDQKINPLFFVDIWQTIRAIKDPYLLACALGAAYFLMIGAFVQSYLVPYGGGVLDLSKEDSVFLFTFVAFGIGAGSILAGKLSGRTVEYGVVPLGAIVLTLSLLGLALVPSSFSATAQLNYVRCLMFAIGLGGGLFIVPLQSYIQDQSPRQSLGQILAASSFFGFIGALIAGVVVLLFGWMTTEYTWFTPRTGFLFISILTLGLSVGAVKILPDFFFRFMLLLGTRLGYRLKIRGIDNVPREGPAVLICNHVSWADAFCIIATQQRRVRFLMSRRMIESSWWISRLAPLAGVIPIQSKDSPGQLATALDAARAALDEGYLVCIFAEGAISRNAQLLPFKSGFERILEGSDHPIIPIYIGGAWGSLTSYAYGTIFSRKIPKAMPYPIDLHFGEAMPADSTAFDVRQRIIELSVDYYEQQKPNRVSLGESFIRSARKCWSHRAVNDTTGKACTYGETLIGSLAMAQVLKERLGDEKHIGILLPASVGGVLANMAVEFLGKVSVNMNYTASPSSFASAIAQCEMGTMLTSRAALERFSDLPMPAQVICLEDLQADIKRRLGANWIRAKFLPAKQLLRHRNFSADNVATIIFSSGSTGEPKGVMLSHHNIQSNVESLRMISNCSEKDHICAALPFFHSFGYTATIWLPLLSGFAAGYHPNPLEAGKIAAMAGENKSTILIATPTFLLGYIRKAKPEQFQHLRMVLVGAEKLKQRVAEAFEKKFGVAPLEGYGATELSPVAAINVPDIKLDGLHQKGQLPGSVGQPVPGVAMKIVDPDTEVPLPPGEAGLLLVKGPNVMVGYLGNPEKTKEVITDGWYRTGDLATMDRTGFVTITDRLSRFSKIAGEMVPHIGVEEALHQVLNKTEQVLVVTGVPDEKKGEKLIVLYIREAGDPEAMRAALAETDLPNLWKPAPNAYLMIDAIPMLGSGKLDLKQIKDLALRKVQ